MILFEPNKTTNGRQNPYIQKIDSRQVVYSTVMDRRLERLKEAEGRFKNKSSNPKIQKIPAFLRQIDVFRKYCCMPKMISMGPIHHGGEDLKEGEHYKLLWASKFVRGLVLQDAQDLLKRIEDNMEEVKQMFSEDAIEGYQDNELAWMLFVDGCSLLYFMEYANTLEAVNLKLDQFLCMMKDIRMLENQLPRRLLEMLCQKDLSSLIRNFAGMEKLENCGELELVESSNKAIHLLDYICRLCHYHDQIKIPDKGQKKDGKGVKFHCFTNKNIRDLKKAGIQLVPVKPQGDVHNMWNNVSFTSKCFSGELRLPFLSLSDGSCQEILNMIAYEMCPQVATEYQLSSYFSFLDSLIDTAEDVKELRLAGVFENLLGSDQDLANLLNQMGEAFPASTLFTSANFRDPIPCSKKCADVKKEIEKHYNCKWRTWLAEAWNTHFRTPWSICTLLAGLLLLMFSFIQTCVAVCPDLTNKIKMHVELGWLKLGLLISGLPDLSVPFWLDCYC